MCSRPKAPKPPPVLPEAPTLPDPSSESGGGNRDRKRRAAAMGQGAGSTILTSSRGVTNSATTAGKTLLGS